MAHSFKSFVPVPDNRWVPGPMSAALTGFHDTLLLIAYTKSAVRFVNIPASIFYDFRQMTRESVIEAREDAALRGWIGYEPVMVGKKITGYTYWLLDTEGKPLPPPRTKYGKGGVFEYDREAWERIFSKCQARASVGKTDTEKKRSVGKTDTWSRAASAKLTLSFQKSLEQSALNQIPPL